MANKNKASKNKKNKTLNKKTKQKKIKNTKNSKENKTTKNKTKKQTQEKTKIKKKLNLRVFGLLTIIFLIAELLGIFVAQRLIELGIKGSTITGDPNNPLEAIYLITMILFVTGIIIFLIKHKKQKKFLWLFEILAVFATTTIVFGVIIQDDFIVLLIALMLIILRLKNKKNVWLRDLVSIIAVAGAGAIIGVSIGIFPVLLFITLLSIYDFIAVFKTKHMLELGKSVTKQNMAFTIAMPTKEHKFELGNGDLVIPLVVVASVLASPFFTNNFLVALLCLVGSYIGLIFSIYIVAKKKIALPALPPQTIIMLIIIGIAFLLGL
jgi:presenilin-like A22 family membrane protease